MFNLFKKQKNRFHCPCCNLTEVEDSDYGICDSCGWENDPSQLANPDMSGGANKLSLNEARTKFTTSNGHMV